VYLFAIEATVRGYHVYQSIWDAAIDGENMECFREVGNIYDPSAVAIIIRKDGSVVGHVPRAVSAVCSSLKYFSSPDIVIILGNSVFHCI